VSPLDGPGTGAGSPLPSGDLVQGTLDVVGVMVVSLDRQGRVTLINRKGCEILGCGREEVVGRIWFEHFLPPTQRQEVRQVYDRIMAGDLQPVEHYENPVLARDGTERIIAWHNTVLRDSSGGIVGTLSAGEDITELRRTEAERARTAAHLRALIDNSPDIIYSIGADRRVLYFSPSFWRYGYAPEEVLGRDFLPMVHPEDRDELARDFERALKEGRVLETRFRGVTRDGAVRHFEVHGRAIWRQEEPPQVVGVLRDVTERWRAEEALHRSEERYRRLFEQSSDAILIHALDGRILDVNEQACEMLGRSREELLGLPPGALFRDGAVPAPLAEMAGGGPEHLVRLEACFARKDGSPVDVELSVRVIEKENGIAQMVVRDITLRKRLQDEQRRYAERLEAEVADRTRQIRESEERHRALFENVDHAIVVTDLEGLVRSWNPAAVGMFGLGRAEAEGRPLEEAVGPGLGLEGPEGVRRIALQPGPWSQEGSARGPGGAEIPVHVSASAVRDAEGRPRAVIWLFADLSEKERLAGEARRA